MMLQVFSMNISRYFLLNRSIPTQKKEGAFRLPGALFGAETFDGSSQGESWGAKSDSVLIGWTGCVIVMTHRLVAESSRSSPQSPWNSLVSRRGVETSILQAAPLVAMIVEDIFILRFWYSDACFGIDVSLLHFLQQTVAGAWPWSFRWRQPWSGHGPWSNISGERISTQINIPWSWSGILATGGEQTKSFSVISQGLNTGALTRNPLSRLRSPLKFSSVGEGHPTWQIGS